MLKIIMARLGEASTWKGILSLLVGMGMNINGAQVDAIALVMVSVYGLLSVFFPDKFTKKDDPKT
jgi:hypothetical protein